MDKSMFSQEKKDFSKFIIFYMTKLKSSGKTDSEIRCLIYDMLWTIVNQDE